MANPFPTTQLLTLAELTAKLRVSRTAIYNRMRELDDPLPKPIKIGRVNRWSEQAVRDWLARRATHAAA